ncbi:hypothetical protein [Mycobacterium tuberculosis]|uniref:hypothetical protein n=1 Tax=Mycobacterium tuberculosis TaxID=1773 RepID=UPI001F36DBED|nr:hypothetical protein [Mycobacterium tuberculosis]
MTDVHIGWVFTRTVRNNARTHILAGLKASVTEIPHGITGLDFDNGTVNRPGMSGDSSSWKGWGHVRWFIEEVPAGAA